MSALAGFWSGRGSDIHPRQACERILAAQRMYGPDACDQWAEDDIALGRALFRTLPEDIHDRQPLLGAGGRYRLVADLRLDNRDALSTELNIRDSAQLADAAILLVAIERWGVAAVERLEGDFAFAVWDRDSQILSLARDFLGQRPLVYHRGGGFFAFASMPKGLHALAQIPRAPYLPATRDFLALVPERGSQTFFEGLERVQPGHVLTVSSTSLTTRSYWEPSRPSRRALARHDYVEELRHHLDRAVAVRLRGTGAGVATHLSAGLDSAAVTATAALMVKGGGRVAAYTAAPRAGFEASVGHDRLADEAPLAAATAARFANVDHFVVRSNAQSPVAELDRYVWLFDRPVMNLCNLAWLSRISGAACDTGHRVMLTGQMGNLTFSYAGREALAERVGRGEFMAAARMAGRLIRGGDVSWKQAFRHATGPFLPERLWSALVALRGHQSRFRDYSALREDIAAELTAGDHPDERFKRPARDSFDLRLTALRQADLGNYNKGQLAGWQIDCRDPTADRRLVEFCLSVPTEEFVRGGKLRALAKAALADRLPGEVIDERRKGYQGADWFEGLAAARDTVAEEVDRLTRCMPAESLVDVPRLQRAVEQWPVSRWEQEQTMLTYRLALLRGIAAGHFLRKASGSNA